MLLVNFGPPAVGKMTVGRTVAAAGRFRLFHNHMTIEPLLETFGYGTPPFNTLNEEFRRRVLEEAAGHDVDLLARHPHLVLDTVDASPAQTAGRIIEWVDSAPRA